MPRNEGNIVKDLVLWRLKKSALGRSRDETARIMKEHLDLLAGELRFNQCVVDYE